MASDARTRAWMARAWTGAARKTLIRAAFGAVLGLAVFGPAFADAVTIRVGAHADYGRIVFAWSQPVQHQAEIQDGRLVVVFDREIEADYAPALRILRRFLKDATPGADGRSVSFALAGNFGLRTFRNKGAVVVDLLDNKAPAAEAPKPQDPAAEAAPAADPKAPAAAASIAERVRVRAGIHADKTRLVIDWQAPVAYALDRQGDTLTLFFDRPASLELGRIGTNPPPRVLAATAESSPASSVLTFAIAPGAAVHHFLAGTRVVVDILAADFPSPSFAEAPAGKPTESPPSRPAAQAALRTEPPAAVAGESPRSLKMPPP
ncbi:MAG: hypothetical protein AAB223_02325, partial [Pseudomonadota bacterium]